MASSSSGRGGGGSCFAVRRIAREFKHIQAEGISPTIHLAPHGGSDLTLLDALVIGPPETPYDGALLRFSIKVPAEYPIVPPKVTFLSTDGGSLRLHPQLYKDGKVCLSILGTWFGPSWSATNSLRGVLLSIQSLLNEEPLRCEPGREAAPAQAVERANVFVVHESVRVSILPELASDTPSWGADEEHAHFTAAMRSNMAARRAPLLRKLTELAKVYDGKVIQAPFEIDKIGGHRCYAFASLAERLAELLPVREGDAPAHSPSSASSATPAAASGVGPEEVAKEGDERGRSQSSARSPGDDGEDATPEGACCRVCHQSEEESGLPLIAPCRCSGSIGHAHAKCVLEWMQFSLASSSSSSRWRCDICKEAYYLKLGPGRPLGLAFLARPLDGFVDDDAEAPGLVAVLLISLLQTLLTTTLRVAAQAMFWVASLVCSPLPGEVGRVLRIFLGAPAAALEVLTCVLYTALVVMKALLALCGAEWRPEWWGAFGEDIVGPIFVAIADCLSFSMGVRLTGLMTVVFAATVSHFAGMVTGLSCLVHFVEIVGGPERADELTASDPGLSLAFVAVGRLFAAPTPPALAATAAAAPAAAASLDLGGAGGIVAVAAAEELGFATMVYSFVALLSLALNAVALLHLLKRAFVDSVPTPLDVLPARCASSTS